MSCVVYYNNHLFADRAIQMDEGIKDLSPIGKGKLYLDPEHRFAVGIAGQQVLESEIWNVVYPCVMEFIRLKGASIDQFVRAMVVADINIDTSLVLFITKENIVYIDRGYIKMLDRDHYYTLGTGRFAARVLIQENYPFDLAKWFDIIATSDRDVSREYEVIDLSILGTAPKKKKVSPKVTAHVRQSRSDKKRTHRFHKSDR